MHCCGVRSCGTRTKECSSVVRKNEMTPFAATGTDLEMVILSEASQTEKDKHHVALLHVESKKGMQTDVFTKQKQTLSRHRKQSHGCQRRRGEG